MAEDQTQDYLAKLEAALWQLPVTERVEILSKIKSEIQQNQDNNPHKSIKETLSTIGEPKFVAKKYLQEKGLTFKKKKKSSPLKWLTIGILGFFLIGCISIGLVIWKFTPLISVDEKEQRVKILGGLIDINEEQGSFKMGGTINIDSYDSHNFVGNKDLATSNIKKLTMEFNSANLNIKPAPDSTFNYSCYVSTKPVITNLKERLDFNFKLANGANCELTIPKDISLELRANNGNFHFKELENNLYVKASNGRIKFEPKPSAKYQYNLSVETGKINDFKNSNDPDAYKVEMVLDNGVIE